MQVSSLLNWFNYYSLDKFYLIACIISGQYWALRPSFLHRIKMAKSWEEMDWRIISGTKRRTNWKWHSWICEVCTYFVFQMQNKTIQQFVCNLYSSSETEDLQKLFKSKFKQQALDGDSKYAKMNLEDSNPDNLPPPLKICALTTVQIKHFRVNNCI